MRGNAASFCGVLRDAMPTCNEESCRPALCMVLPLGPPTSEDVEMRRLRRASWSSARLAAASNADAIKAGWALDISIVVRSGGAGATKIAASGSDRFQEPGLRNLRNLPSEELSCRRKLAAPTIARANAESILR